MTTPTLEQLKTRPCSLKELQAALVKTIELHETVCEAVARLESQLERMNKTVKHYEVIGP